jgi:hypothetical protein
MSTSLKLITEVYTDYTKYQIFVRATQFQIAFNFIFYMINLNRKKAFTNSSNNGNV